jgi:hypothetical protein
MNIRSSVSPVRRMLKTIPMTIMAGMTLLSARFGIEVGYSRGDLQGHIFKLGRARRSTCLRTLYLDIAILLTQY